MDRTDRKPEHLDRRADVGLRPRHLLRHRRRDLRRYQKALNFTNIGNLTLALFLTSAIVQLIIGPLVDKFGYKPVAIGGYLVAAAAMLALEMAPNVEMAIFGCILLGIGAMCLNTVGNTLIPVVLFGGKDPARASNFGNAFFGLGLVVTPLLFSFVDWKVALFILVALFVVGLLLALSTTFPQVSTGYQFSMALNVLGKPAVLIGIVALFCYISLESSMSTWSKPYVTEMLGGVNDPTAVQRAGFALSLFGVAMMVGRFATSAIKNLTAIGVRLIAGAAVVATLAIITMITTSSGTVAVACVALTGLVFAPIFPTIIGVTFAKFDPSLYGSIFGIMFSIGLLGATFVPKIIGDLSQGAGGSVQASLKIVAAIAAALVIISLFLNVGSKAKVTART